MAKGLFFDVEPLMRGRPGRSYDVEATLGQYYSYLHFQHLFAMDDAVWAVFLAQGWFPFANLNRSTVERMIQWARAGYAIDEHLGQIAEETVVTVARQAEGWAKHPVLAPHAEVLAAAVRNLQAGDYVSATAILFPRIEGVLRSHHFADPGAPAASQSNLIASAVERSQLPAHGRSLLLPERFRRYLKEVYFADFDPKNPRCLSRNTVAHGVAPQHAFDQKGAVLGFQTLLQIVALLPRDQVK